MLLLRTTVPESIILYMKKEWHPDELAHHWSLSPDERDLLGNKSGATRLNFAILLKAFQLNGRFPERQDDVAGTIVAFVAKQVGVAPEVYFEEDWSERTQRLQRAQVRDHCSFRAFHGEDEGPLVQWLSERVVSPDPDAEVLKVAAYGHLRSQQLEPPGPDRLRRLLGAAVERRKQRLLTDTVTQLSPETRAALDALVQTGASESEADQLPLRPGAAAMHGRVDAAGVGVLAGETEVFEESVATPIARRVERLDLDTRAILDDPIGADLVVVIGAPAALDLLKAWKRELDGFFAH